MERIQEYCEIEKETTNQENIAAFSEEWPTDGRIVIKNLTMRYREGLEPVIK